MDNSPRSFFGRFHTLTLILLFLAAAAIRLYDLTDLPLDFHPTRQLFSAIKARGMYYVSAPDVSISNADEEMREFAIQQGKQKVTVEPEVLERLVVSTWKFTGEQLWVARVYSILFWLIGGVFLYLLARDLFTKDGALFATAFYLFLPYAVLASRSFQPDPLMVALILGFWWSVNRWAKTLEIENNTEPTAKRAKNAKQELNRSGLRELRGSDWTWVILASLFGGFAIFIKLNAAFFIVGGALGAALGRASIRDLLRNKQVYAMAALGILPGAMYVAYGLTHGFLGQQFGGRFIPSLLLSPAYPLGWAQMIGEVLGLFTFAIALLALTLVNDKPTRIFLLGLWGAYLIFGIFFDYHISTHNYYSLPLIPIAALTLTPLGEAIMVRLTESAVGSGWKRFFIASFLTLSLFAVLWTSRVTLKSVDYRPEADFWNRIGEMVRDYRVVALSQDYNSRLVYWGWANAAVWPDSSDIDYHSDVRGGGQTFDKRFAKLTEGKDLFLVTDLTDFARQPDLQERLSHFAIFAEGEGYIIYDLQQPIP